MNPLELITRRSLSAVETPRKASTGSARTGGSGAQVPFKQEIQGVKA
jgi:hypothetical protein